MPNVALIILRAFFVLVAAGIGVGLISSNLFPTAPSAQQFAIIFVSLGVAAAVVILDIFVRPKRVESMTAVYFGLIVGLFLTYVVQLAISPLLPPNASPQVIHWIQVVIGTLLCYACISLL